MFSHSIFMSDNENVFIKYLPGYSGCNIALYKRQNIFFVRKDAGFENYNERLIKQCEKQENFISNTARIPRVLNKGYADGLFYFDMEFARGTNLAVYMRNIQVKEIHNIMNIIFSCIKRDESVINPDAKKIFGDKILSLEKKIKEKSNAVREAIEKIKTFDFSGIPMSPCFGDLTLENMIVSPNGDIFMIDLLDSFYNSWMIDVAKLLQDLEAGWAYRYAKMDYNLNMRLEVAKQILNEKILKMPNGKALLRDIYRILLLNLLRIYPYVNDAVTKAFLDGSVKKILNSGNIE